MVGLRKLVSGEYFGTALHLMDFGGAISQTRDVHACVVLLFFFFLFKTGVANFWMDIYLLTKISGDTP